MNSHTCPDCGAGCACMPGDVVREYCIHACREDDDDDPEPDDDPDEDVDSFC